MGRLGNGNRKAWEWEGLGIGRLGNRKVWEWEGLGMGRNRKE
jgi:hypothetical protein